MTTTERSWRHAASQFTRGGVSRIGGWNGSVCTGVTGLIQAGRTPGGTSTTAPGCRGCHGSCHRPHANRLARRHVLSFSLRLHFCCLRSTQLRRRRRRRSVKGRYLHGYRLGTACSSDCRCNVSGKYDNGECSSQPSDRSLKRRATHSTI
jgi:hypothetical protein